MTTKTCRECGEEKDLSLFLAQTRMAGGYLNQCKQCIATSKKTWVVRNRDKVRAYFNKYNRTSKGRAAQKRHYAKLKATPRYAEKLVERNRARALKHPIKIAARITVRQAKYHGELSSSEKCSQCQSGENIHGHHEDYTKPLDIEWLCGDCHGLRHQEINRLIRNGEDWSEKGF